MYIQSVDRCLNPTLLTLMPLRPSGDDASLVLLRPLHRYRGVIQMILREVSVLMRVEKKCGCFVISQILSCYIYYSFNIPFHRSSHHSSFPSPLAAAAEASPCHRSSVASPYLVVACHPFHSLDPFHQNSPR